MMPTPVSHDPETDPDPADPALLQAWLVDRRPADFTEIVRRHLGLVRGTAFRQLGDDLADDVTQMVFAILARKAPGLTKLHSLSAWLHRVTLLQCRSAVRRRIRERRSQHAAMENARLADARDPLAEALPHLDAAIGSLSETDRELILLRYSEGLTFPQAALRTGRSEAALRQQASRAVEKLSALLRRRGVPVPALTLSSGLGLHLSGAGSAEAASQLAAKALTTASTVTGPFLAIITLATMSTAKSILTGALLAVALATGPIYWRSREIIAARHVLQLSAKAAAPSAMAAATSASKAPTLGAPPVPAAPATPASTETDEALLEELGKLMMKEVEPHFNTWNLRRNWLEARRAGRALGLSPETEAALLKFLEELREDPFGMAASDEEHAQESAEPGKPGQQRRDEQTKLAEWLATHLTPEQWAMQQRLEGTRRAALVERLAEEALYKVSGTVPLTSEQKTKLYDAAAAKVVRSLEEDEYGGILQFGAYISQPKKPPVEEASNDVVASVLDPAQQELWQQTMEQDQLLSQAAPRHLSDRALQLIREHQIAEMLSNLMRPFAAPPPSSKP